MARLIYVLFLIGLCSLAAIVGWVNDALKEYTDNKFYRFLNYCCFILFSFHSVWHCIRKHYTRLCQYKLVRERPNTSI